MFNIFSSLMGGTDSGQLADAIKDGAMLVDVRSAGEFREGSVRGAVNIPLDTIASNLGKFKGKKNIVVFCRSGARSGQAKSILQQNGITNVINGGPYTSVNQVMNSK